MVEVDLHLVTAVALELVMEVVLGLVTVVVLGVATVAVRGEVIVGALGPVTVPLFGTATVMGFTTAGGSFSDRVLVSMASAIRGGGVGTILTMQATRIILIPIRTTAIPMAMRTTATDTTGVRPTIMGTTAMRIMVTHIMGTVMLARPLRRHFKPH